MGSCTWRVIQQIAHEGRPVGIVDASSGPEKSRVRPARNDEKKSSFRYRRSWRRPTAGRSSAVLRTESCATWRIVDLPSGSDSSITESTWDVLMNPSGDYSAR
jgi:hypothetical protein